MAFERSYNQPGFVDAVTGKIQSLPSQYTEDQILRVSGTGFGTKSRQQPTFTEDFSSYNVGDVLIDSKWKQYQTNGGGNSQ